MSNNRYTVLITGANRGLGLEFVKQYAVDDYEVIACTRKINKNDDLHRLQASFENISIQALDVENFLAIDQLAKTLKKSIDILINNAGLYPNSSFDAIDYEAWLNAFKINTLAAFKMVKAFYLTLKRAN